MGDRRDRRHPAGPRAGAGSRDRRDHRGGRDPRVPVVVDPSQPCGACPTCSAGSEDLCPHARFAGFGATDGGLRDWMAWPRHLLLPIPSDLDPIEACQLEALGVALRAVERAAVGPTTRVAVIGTGPIGLLVVRACRARGATWSSPLIGWPTASMPPRASGATSTWVADGHRTPVGLEQVDVAIECAGADDAVATALDVVRPGGHVVLVGIPADDRTSFQASAARRKGVTISLSRRMRGADLRAAVELVRAGRVSLGRTRHPRRRPRGHPASLRRAGRSCRCEGRRRGSAIV